ncbi:uncharacterized protein N7482_006842 [Penicillium canariense]|uniref:FAD-binding FR-type domain-containing protein n=1 Tax=Penicillium canariense TaxID=189055 RepID=A0A9W9HXX3_9EURO|nr:uncharacterized protein N7482_006842 [Penicillium canariense]KAJ5159838.1 hypothetical protein N7482_006842 [Penicillium canariense]
MHVSFNTGLLWAAWHISLANAIVKHGIVGMGINMYKPFCCNACFDTLSPLHLSCTNDENVTYAACRASNKPWLETLAYCFEQKCADDGLSTSETGQCWIKMAAEGLAVPPFQAIVPVSAPAVELSDDAVFLKTSSRVNEAVYEMTHESYEEWEYEEDMHSRTAIPVPQVLGLKISQYVTTPALFNSRHRNPLPYYIGYMPSRSLSLVIVLYIALNITFSLLPIANPWKHINYPTPRQEIAAYFANRVGVLSFANIALAVLFAGRNNPLMLIAGFDQTACFTFHRWAARVATVQAIIHSILFTLYYTWDGGYATYATEAAKAYYWWGIIGTVVLCLAITSAVLVVRVRFYGLFLVTHIGLAMLALIACWYHIIERYSKNWGYEVWLYISFAFWGFDRFVRLLRIGIYNNIWPISQSNVELVANSQFVKITVFPKRAWDFKAGQHCYLYLPSAGKFYESHPFSVAGWVRGTAGAGDRTMEQPIELAGASNVVEKIPNTSAATDQAHAKPEASSSPSVYFIIRPSKGATLRLHKQLVASSQRIISMPVIIEGPYGHEPPLGRADRILCIAGGIGITSILSYVQRYLEDRSAKTRLLKAEKLVVVWSAKEQELIDTIREQIPANGTVEGLELQVICTENTIPDRRMDLMRTVSREAEQAQRLAVVVCGPGQMADVARKAVVSCLADGRVVELHEEAFAW